jgi:tRNA-dihydrouridine synthase A
MDRLVAQGEPWSRASRHLLGLWNGTPGARHWRQVWSDHRRKLDAPADVSRAARREVLPQNVAAYAPVGD